MTPKYLKCKPGADKPAMHVAENSNRQDDHHETRNPKVQSKSQISTHKPAKNREQHVYGTVGSSPDSKVLQGRAAERGQSNQTKSLSNNSR